MAKRVETRLQMLGEYWDWNIREKGGEMGGNKLLDTRYQRPLEGPFYHGTDQVLQPGQVIEPTVYNNNAPYLYPSNAPDNWAGMKNLPLDDAGNPVGDKDSYAFAAQNIDVARRYALLKQRKRENIGKEAYIYEVEPIVPDHHYDPEDSYSYLDRGDRGGAEAFRSPTGWRVMRVAEVLPPLQED